MQFQAVIFDMDGVIIDSEPLSLRALEATADALAYSIPAASMAGYPGQAAHMVFADIEPFGDGRFSITEFETLYKAIYSSWLPHVATIPGALELIQAAQDNGPIALATSTARNWAMDVVRQLDLSFGTIVAQEDVAQNKPAPDAYIKASSGLGVDPSQCLVIEDSLSGVAAGVAAGCTVWAYDGSFPRTDLEARGAHRVFSSHFDIIRELT
ncbi:MAG: HAD superfamily hydrolase (TIGR01509 family) [Rhodothermales bacterium]|jgi:HAD superfamily hydrolase (TIGR01509 family)